MGWGGAQEPYAFHLSLGEDAGEHQHAERHREDEDEGEGQGGSRGHDGPEHGQAEQLQGCEQVHTEGPNLGGAGCRARQVSPGFSPASERPVPRRAIRPATSRGRRPLSPPQGWDGSASLGLHGLNGGWPGWADGGLEGDPHRPGGGRGTGPFRARSHLLDIGDVWVVFGWHEKQVQPLIELDPVKGGNSHVQENPEEHSQGDLPEQIPDDQGEAWGRRRRNSWPQGSLPQWPQDPSGKAGRKR